MSTTATQAADSAAEAMHDLCYATMPGAGLEHPADLYEVVASLKLAHQREQQVLQQCKDWLHREHSAGRVGHDARIDPRPDVVATAAALADTLGMLASVERALNEAHTASAHLTGLDSRDMATKHGEDSGDDA